MNRPAGRPGGGKADDEFEDAPPEPVVASSPSEGSATEIADLVLQLISQTSVLGVLLMEAEEAEVRSVAARLEMFRGLVAALPVQGKPRKAMGFKPRKRRAQL